MICVLLQWDSDEGDSQTEDPEASAAKRRTMEETVGDSDQLKQVARAVFSDVS